MKREVQAPPEKEKLEAKLSEIQNAKMKKCQSELESLLKRYGIELVPVIMMDGKGAIAGSITMRPIQ